VARDRLPDAALLVEDDQAAGPGDAALLGGQRAHDHPAAGQRRQRGGEADAAGACPVFDLREQRCPAVRADLDDGGTGALHVAGVVEVADQDVAPVQAAGAAGHDGHGGTAAAMAAPDRPAGLMRYSSSRRDFSVTEYVREAGSDWPGAGTPPS